MTRFFDLFVQRPRLAGAIAIVALVAGAFSLTSLPVAFFPSVARPTISVTCTYPGANAREVMNTVAGPIEDQVNGVEGFDHMTSSCADTGAYTLTVYFQAGYDRDLALMKVQAAVQQALTQLPQEVKNTGVTVGIGQTIDLGYVTCYSERGELTRDEVVDYVFGVVSPAIKRVPGVGASSVQDEKIAMRVWLDSDRLAALGLGSSDVVAAIKAQNVQASLGTVGASPVDGPGCRVISLVAKGRLHTAEEFGAIIVRTKERGGVVYLRDIARIELGHETYAHSGLFGDKPACVLHMYQIPGANTLETIARVKALLAGLEKRFPGDLRWDMTVDVSRYSGSALHGAALALALAFAASFLFLLVVFRSLRLALVPFLSSAVPLALVLSAMAATGSFITVLTLYALAASVVVMVGMAAYVAVAFRENRLDETRIRVLLAADMVTMAFLVLMFVGGVQGLILRPFALVFAATGVASAVNALLIVPAFCRLVFGDVWRLTRARPAAAQTPFGLRFVAFGALAALAVAALAFAARVPKDLVPNEDLGVVLVDYKTREGTSRPEVEAVVKEACARFGRACAIEKSCTVFGEGIFSGSGENVAKSYLVLKPWAERGAGEHVMEIIARLRAAVADLPNVEINLLTIPTLPGFGTIVCVSPLVLSVAENDPVRLAREARRIQAEFKRSPIADAVTCGYNTDAPHLRLHVDRAKCELLNVPLLTLFTTLQHALGSVYVNDINLGTQVNRVTLMSDWAGRSTPEAMAALHVRSATGAMVPVSTLVSYEEELGPRAIYRYNRYIYCTVDLTPKTGVSLTDAMAEVSRILERELPRDFDTGWTGIAYEESEGAERRSLLMLLPILAVYLVLLVRHESWRRAFLELAPTVAAVAGAVIVLYLTSVSLSLYSRFALLMLVTVLAAFSLCELPGDSFGRRAILPLLGAVLALPLVFSSGAGALGSRSLGLTLLAGYLAYAAVGLPISAILRTCRLGAGRPDVKTSNGGKR